MNRVMNRMSRTSRPTRFVSVAMLATASMLGGGCSDGGKSTTGRRILLGTSIAAAPEGGAAFANAQGWSIKVDKLLVSTGALYYFEGATIFSQNDVPSNRTYDLLNRFIGIRTAYAHPGHYVPGNARGQLLNGLTVDLHAGPVLLAVGEGVTGIVRSATFSFGVPPEGELAGLMESHVAIIEGTATRESDVRVFRAEITASDMLNANKMAAIEGCPFVPTNMDGDGAVTLTIELPLWFDQVEFDAVPASVDGRPVLVPDSSIAHNQLVRGMKAGDGYVFSYSKR